ncbi:hypothetical protein [Streptomyces sp. A1-5]|uniref:hypothetical protein n=1 Tax=Streptomyces sp. A1-5 TaxID=2738410 RepID=UPI001F256F02|nr:hypothetical protein [Streptomyces sp. A1-5]UJB41104.1 hypothetical protein HRD51_09965 [Streptomyces sp. A1-5]
MVQWTLSGQRLLDLFAEATRGHAAELVGAADETREVTHERVLEPAVNPPALDEHVNRVRDCRSEFTAAAGLNLDSLQQPTP